MSSAAIRREPAGKARVVGDDRFTKGKRRPSRNASSTLSGRGSSLAIQLDVVTPSLSLFAFAEILEHASQLAKAQFLLPPDGAELAFLRTEAERTARNRLQARWLARPCAGWIENKVGSVAPTARFPQGAVVLRDGSARPHQVVLGSFAFSTEGLGITPRKPLSLIQASETGDESNLLSQCSTSSGLA